MFAPIALSVALSFAAAADNDDAYKLAEAYLNALVGKGDQAAREMHLNGLTFMAQTTTLDSWKLVRRDPPQKEKGDLAEVSKMLSDIDKAGRKALDKMASMAGEKGDEGQEMGVIDEAKAKKLMAPAQALMDKLSSKYPTIAKVARVDKELYWHPKNPIRPLMDQTKKKGKYDLELHRFQIESKDGRKTRQWGLKIIRFKVDDGFDTGWKILPAADWNPDE
jgi:hypothetical protein